MSWMTVGGSGLQRQPYSNGDGNGWNADPGG
jgi:hypothetical protein